jgi:tRNA A37 threonylcarbamoyladenosine dehydratase
MVTKIELIEVPLSDTQPPDLARRFGGIARLYGQAALDRFQAAHVCVIGIGGVGSWAAEALARSAIGRITLIDLDNIAESNVNRQLHALDGEFGKAKVSAMAERIHAINPDCKVQEIEDFITLQNLESLLGQGYNGIIDAIDDSRMKAAMAAYCRKNKLALVMTGGAGGRLDPARITHADLAKTSGDRLLAKVRTILRHDYEFPRTAKSKFHIPCIYSDEPIIQPTQACTADNTTLSGLSCAGYGSSVCVTASFGMAAAALILKQLSSFDETLPNSQLQSR